MDQETKEILFEIKETKPSLFKKKKVLEIGSLNLDQIEDFSIRDLFEDCRYTGVDINAGKDVDVVGHFGDVVSSLSGPYDFILCLNCLEHDIRWRETTIKALSLLKKGGYALFHTPTKLSIHQFIAFAKASKFFKENSNAESLLNPEMHWQPTPFMKGVDSSTHISTSLFKSETGGFPDGAQRLHSPVNTENTNALVKKIFDLNPRGIHLTTTWNYTVQHNVHMTKPDEYYSNVSSGEFLELLAINNILPDYDIKISVNKTIGLTFTALIQKKRI